MGKLAKVISCLKGILTLDLGGGVFRQVDRVYPPGIDAAPIPGEVAYVDGDKSPGVFTQGTAANPGDIILVGRDASGAVRSSIRVLSTGQIELSNSAGSLILGLDGNVTISGEATIGIIPFSGHVHVVPNGISEGPQPGAA